MCAREPSLVKLAGMGHFSLSFYCCTFWPNNTSLLEMMTQQYCWKLKTWDVPGHKVPATDYLHPESPFPHHLSHPRVSQRMRGFRLGHLLILSELIHWWSCCNRSVWFMEVLHTTSRKAMCTLLWVREEPTTQSPLHLLNSACPRNPVASHQNSAGPGRLEEWNFHFHKMSIPVLFWLRVQMCSCKRILSRASAIWPHELSFLLVSLSNARIENL